MDKLDLKKQYRYLYSPSAKAPEIVEVPQLIYIIVIGQVYQLWSYASPTVYY